MCAVDLIDKTRVFYSPRSQKDKNGNFISYVSFLDLDLNDPSKVLYVHDVPIVNLGKEGAFDEHGTMVAKPVKFGNKIYLYYMGWRRLIGESNIPYEVNLGLAISDNNGLTFRKVSENPIFSLDKIDPISIGNISIIHEDGIFKIWYTSYTRWCVEGLKPTPEYNIKYAESTDGFNWSRNGLICIDEDEKGGVATPSVVNLNGKYHMWFGFRKPYDDNGNSGPYSIGYAISEDGKKWNRNDNYFTIDKSSYGWDSQMICYPHIIKRKNKLIMFYCGNDFGREGFGYAECIL
jgi:predicted GH43/DUF377 family glycosyl hydrolase